MQNIKNDSKILEEIDSHLRNLEHKMIDSVDCMKRAIAKSKDFLEGNHFEAAQQIVENSSSRLQTVCESIEGIHKYISDMQTIIEEYSKLTYKG